MRKDARLKGLVKQQVIDVSTAEVIDEKSITYIEEDDKEFYMTYCKVLGLMEGFGAGEMKVMAWMIGNMQFNQNKVVITGEIKDDISREMGISVSTISNALTKLLKTGLLYRSEGSQRNRSGVYLINPEYHWKGDLRERQRMLKLVLSNKSVGEHNVNEPQNPDGKNTDGKKKGDGLQ